MLLLRLIACVALLVAIAPAPASARPKVAGRAKAVEVARPTVLALQVAGRSWGAVPCGGRITVLTRRSLPFGLGADSDAWVTFDTPLGANDLRAAATDYTACTISLARSRWPSRASMIADWDLLCMTMTHEVGHLLGHEHDTTPGSVMAAMFTDYSGEPAGCRTTRPAS